MVGLQELFLNAEFKAVNPSCLETFELVVPEKHAWHLTEEVCFCFEHRSSIKLAVQPSELYPQTLHPNHPGKAR